MRTGDERERCMEIIMQTLEESVGRQAGSFSLSNSSSCGATRKLCCRDRLMWDVRCWGRSSSSLVVVVDLKSASAGQTGRQEGRGRDGEAGAMPVPRGFGLGRVSTIEVGKQRCLVF